MFKIYFCFFLLFSGISSIAQTSDFSPILFKTPEGKSGFKNTSEQVVIEAEFEEAAPFTGNYAFVKKSNLWGLINTKGKWIIPASYEDLGWTLPKDQSVVLDGVVGYKQKGKWGLVSLKNKVVSPPVYDVLLPFTNDKIKAGQLSGESYRDTLLGIADLSGKEIIPLKYHQLETTPMKGILLVGTNKLYTYTPSGELQGSTNAYGLLSWTNTVLLPSVYKSISIKDQGFEVLPFNIWKLLTHADSTASVEYTVDSLFAVSADKYGFTIGSKTGILANASPLKAHTDAIYPENKGFILYQANQKYGVLLAAGSEWQMFLPAAYDSIRLDTEELIRAGTLIKNNEWQWQLLQREKANTAAVVAQSYNWIEPLSQKEWVKVKNKNLYGYINKQGMEVIPVAYDSLGSFQDSVCVAIYKGKYGVLQYNNKWLFEPKAEFFAINQSGYFIRRQNGKYEVLDKAGKVKYSSAESLQFMADGSIVIKQKGKTGRISPTGIFCVPPVYDSISLMTKVGTFWAYTGKHNSLYKDNGEMLLKPGNIIERILYVKNEEFFPARINGKHGFVDGFGRLRISNQYQEVRPFEGKVAAIKLAGKWGFVTRDEKIAIQPYYDQVGAFKNDKVIAKKGNKYGIVDLQGKVLTPFSFDTILEHSSGNYVAISKGKQGMINRKGFEIVYAKYDEVLLQADNKAIVKLNNKYGLLDAKGLIILPAAYDRIIKNEFSAAYLAFTQAQLFKVEANKLLPKAVDRKN